MKILQPTNLKDPEFLKDLDSLKADLQIVVAFRMLPKEVWAMPEFGTFNLHASLLPQYRGAAPINWAIINGESKTGVSTFFINENIDTGAILLQKEIPISGSCSAGELHDILMKTGSELIIETVALIITKKYKAHEQPAFYPKPAPKLNKENCRIDWTDSLDSIHNLIRGLSPYPAAWSFLKNKGEIIEIKIYKALKIAETHSLETGKLIFSKKEIKVVVDHGYINILDLKLPGKRKYKRASRQRVVKPPNKCPITIRGLSIIVTVHMPSKP